MYLTSGLQITPMANQKRLVKLTNLIICPSEFQIRLLTWAGYRCQQSCYGIMTRIIRHETRTRTLKH